MNRRKVRFVANQSKTLDTIFNPARTGRNKNKKRNSRRRDGKQGSICNKQVERQGGKREFKTVFLMGRPTVPQGRGPGMGRGQRE